MNNFALKILSFRMERATYAIINALIALDLNLISVHLVKRIKFYLTQNAKYNALKDILLIFRLESVKNAL